MKVAQYVRICPGCGRENPTDAMRCRCGVLLAGVDVVPAVQASVPGALAPASAPAAGSAAMPSQSPARVAAPAPSPAGAMACPHADCGQPNPAGATTCVYCDRPLQTAPATLLNLPSALRDHYRIVRPLPTLGSEAELLLVVPQDATPSAGEAPELVLKLYRQGIVPRRDVMEKIAGVGHAHRVEVLRSGVCDGYAYELMEYCRFGSLRSLMQSGPMPVATLAAVVRELAIALHAVHTAHLVHRDVKPENILIRTLEPLDLVLTDFATASPLDATQRFTGMARTMPYAAPESLSGVIDSKADYWALGMLLLEAATGAHPFSGLSEAVIMHHLTTRTIDLAGVADPKLRKLLRGLLLRDPAARWGERELRRWMENDPTLVEPIESRVETGFDQPYRIAGEVCRTPAQLAVALARHWDEATADLHNNQLLSWFRDVVHDQDVVRVLLHLREQTNLHVDVCLLKLLLFLAPGLPPAWRGESIELAAVLGKARLALEGDEAARAWLNALYQHGVLKAFVDAGNAEAAELCARWIDAVDRFGAAWQTATALLKERTVARTQNEITRYDDVVYGQVGPKRPDPSLLHARLLAVAYDARWAAQLRAKLGLEIAALAVHCPWVSEMGDIAQVDAAQLLVIEALVPDMQRMAQRQQKAEVEEAANQRKAARDARSDIMAVMRDLRSFGNQTWISPQDCESLLGYLDAYFEQLAVARANGQAISEWRDVQRLAMSCEPAARELRHLADELSERAVIDQAWLKSGIWGVLATAGILVWLLPASLLPWYIRWLPPVVALGLCGWRILPSWQLSQRIRQLAEGI